KAAEVADRLFVREALIRETGSIYEHDEYLGALTEQLAVLLPLVNDKDRYTALVQRLLTTVESKGGFSWARLLRPVAAHLPKEAVLERWESMKGALVDKRRSFLSFSAPGAVEVAGLLPKDVRDRVIQNVLGDVRAMESIEGS